MDKIWVKDVKEGERLKSVFLVARKAVPTAKSGKTYLSVTFQDKTGELEARAFERVDELAASFEEKDYVEVEGPIGAFQGKPQLKIEVAGKVQDAGALDAAEFAWAPAPEPKKPEKPAAAGVEDTLWNELLGLVDVIADPHVKSLVKAFIEDDDIASRMRRAPAAKTIHHAYAGGLLEHTVSSLKLAHRIADHYPQVDRDMLVAGAFFHDLGKIRELQGDRNVEYTDEGRLVGHLVMTAQWVHDKARRVGVPRDLEHHVVHMILAHHGKLEFGSPKPPMTLEALLTHYIDELDSRVNSWLNLMAREGGSKRWTSADNVYEQPIWRGQLPTVQAEKKGPPAELMTPRDLRAARRRRARRAARSRSGTGHRRRSAAPSRARSRTARRSPRAQRRRRAPLRRTRRSRRAPPAPRARAARIADRASTVEGRVARVVAPASTAAPAGSETRSAGTPAPASPATRGRTARPRSGR